MDEPPEVQPHVEADTDGIHSQTNVVSDTPAMEEQPQLLEDRKIQWLRERFKLRSPGPGTLLMDTARQALDRYKALMSARAAVSTWRRCMPAGKILMS